MQLFDVLKERAGIPTNDFMAFLFARKTRPERLEHYGMKWSKSDPTHRTYLYDCAGWTPMQCQSDGTVDRGSWTDHRAFFLKNLYPVMCKSDGTEDYKLSKSNHAYKEDGVTASDVSNTSYNGNAMSCFDCRIWIKFFDDGTDQGFEVANYQVDESFVDWPYIRADGSHADKLYYPMFEGTVVDGKLRSIGSGKAQSGTTITQELGYAQANDGRGGNSVWEIGDWSHHVWFTCLCMLVSKSTCPEDALGAGNSNGGRDATGFVTNGACIDKGAFWGKPHSSTDSDNVYPVKTFFCENMWANRHKRTLGFYNAPWQQGWFVKTSPPYVISDSYYPDYSGFNDVPINTGWVEELQLTSCGFLPKTSGSVTTNFGGYLVAPQSYGGKPLALGGTCKSGAACGPWFMDLQYGISDTQWWIGASLYLIQPEGV